MKRIVKIIALLLLIPLCSCKKNSNEYKYDGSIYDDSNGYVDKYGYSYFLNKNDNQAKLYKDIYLRTIDFNHKRKDIKSKKDLYTFFRANIKDYSLTLNDTRQVFDIFAYENSEFYYLNEIDYIDNGSYVSFEIYKDYYEANSRSSFNSIINEELKTIDENVSLISDEFAKLEYLYDYIVKNMTFSTDEDENPSNEYYAHNIIGFFDKKEGVCETYSKTFSLLLNKYNYENIPVFSTDHVWNLVKVCNNWFMFDLTYKLFGLCEEEYFILTENKYKYDDIMIELPKMPTSSLSLMNLILYEEGVEIYRSHSIDDIYSKFNGGSYEIVLDALSAKKLDERKFPINFINTNYSSLVIISNDESKDPIENIFTTFIIMIKPLLINKDVTIRRIKFGNRNLDYGPSTSYSDPYKVVVASGATLYVSKGTASYEENIVFIDE